ncbi:MAG: bifunctional 2-polyprenyl-6-hydroxyphenol methylase/3-demethylubiquinol 3-O-methyltransferase UbiG [Limnobacter sp.]|nr:bifunctional 2-polyprenyl-6-hydroxyphenol methylase/3-demethylubiquinol 3-O-methyltransferase UbiG [Limnobacter sp.]
MSSTEQTNFDQAELAKFSALANKWWDPNSEFRPLHEINPLRLNWIDERAQLGGKKVLDVGCGGGILAESMANRGAEVLGIDLADKSLKVAELHRLESGANVQYQLVSAEELAQSQAGQYDVVTCMEMLEHVPDPSLVVKACANLCKPGGWLFFSTINRNPKSFLFAIVGAEYVLNLLPKGTHSYDMLIKPSELAQYARGAGIEFSEIIGLTYNPLTKIYKLARDTDVNYMVACRKPA